MATTVCNGQVNGASKYRRAAPVFHNEDHRMHMVIVALDYKKTARPVSYVTAARNMEELARQSGVQWLTPLYEEDCTHAAVMTAVKNMTSKCGQDDVFVFYFAGHGSSVAEREDQGQTSRGHAFVLVDKNGNVSASTLLAADDVARTVCENCHPKTRILFLTDTCYSSSIVDLNRGAWEDRQVLLISGTQDVPDSGQGEEEDTGGIFTHSLLLAIDKLSKVGRENYSVGMFFNAALHENDAIFRSKQDMLLQMPARFTPDAMAWPLVPPAGYQAPLSRCAGPGGIRSDAGRLGISPTLLQYVQQSKLNVPVSIEEYVNHVQGQSVFAMKPCRACRAGYSVASECVLQ